MPFQEKRRTHNILWNNLKKKGNWHPNLHIFEFWFTFEFDFLSIMKSSLVFFLWVHCCSKNDGLVWSDTDLLWPWSSPSISLEVFLCLPFTLFFYFIWGRFSSWGFAQGGWIRTHGPWNFFIIFATAVTEKSHCLEMVL